MFHDPSYEVFLQQLATLVKAAVPLADGLKNLAPQLPARWRPVAAALAVRLSSGQSLHEAASSLPGTFNSATLSLIEAGERSGRLERMLEHAAQLAKQERTFQSSLLARLAYPVLLYHAAIILPSLRFLFLGSPLSTPAAILAGLLPFYLVLAALIFILNLRHRNSEAGRQCELFLRQLPLSGQVLTLGETDTFIRVLGALSGSGLPWREALQSAGAATGSSLAAREAVRAADAVHAGSPLYEAAQHCAFLDPSTQAWLHTAEQTGRLEETLEQISILTGEQLRHKSSLLTWWIGGILYAGAVLMVLVQVYLILGPMYRQTMELL